MLKIAIPLAIILFALYWLYRDWLFQKRKAQAIGKIIAIEQTVIARDVDQEIWGYEFTVAFTAEAGKSVVVTYKEMQINFYYIGMEVNVSYDKDDPQIFVINGEFGNKAYNGVFPVILLIIGIIILINVLI